MKNAGHATPPQLLQIHRERLKPGREAAYRAIEADTARICAEIGCPHPYLGIEALTGPTEVWFLNGYDSEADQKQVAEDYAQNTTLLAALAKNSRQKARLTAKPVNDFASYRRDSSRGAPWIIGTGRFLVITVTRSKRRVGGTVFDASDGTRFIVTPAQTRHDADAAAALAGPESTIFAVRPFWSVPAKEWIAADPELWRLGPPPKRKERQTPARAHDVSRGR
jgi:hypothetical protein